MKGITINIVPIPLKGIRDICIMFNIKQSTFYDWLANDAPIAEIENGDKLIYCAEYNTLLAWLIDRTNK